MKTYIEGCAVFRGFVKYKDSTKPFFYDCEKNILYIFPTSEEEYEDNRQKLWDLFFEDDTNQNEWLSNNYIFGYSEYTTKIVFETIGEEENINGFMQYKVSKVFEYNFKEESFEGIDGLIFESSELNYFYDASSIYNKLKEETGKIVVESNYDKEKEIASFMFEDMNIKVTTKILNKISSGTEKPLDAKTQVFFTFSKKIKNLAKMIEIIMIQNKFMQLISYRRNVKFENVTTLVINEEKKKEKNGIIIFNKLRDNEKEKDKSRRNRIMKIEHLENRISGIYDLIVNKHIYFSHLCNNIESIKSYDPMRIGRIFAEFERTYEHIYGLNVRSDSYLVVKEKIIKELERMIEQYEGKERRYVKDIIRGFKKGNISLKEKINWALNDCSNIMNDLIKFFYIQDIEVESISERLSDLRNDMIHGEMTYEIKPINLTDIKILEILIYVMNFKYIEIKKENIQDCIKDIFRR